MVPEFVSKKRLSMLVVFNLNDWRMRAVLLVFAALFF